MPSGIRPFFLSPPGRRRQTTLSLKEHGHGYSGSHRKRRSIRSYTDRPLERAELERLINLAVKAPTGSGMEPWGFVVLQDKKEIDTLSERIKERCSAI